MSQKQINKTQNGIYDYDSIISRIYKQLNKELSKKNSGLIKKYDTILVNEAMSKAYRSKTLMTLKNLSKFLGKSWRDATKDDIEIVVKKIMDTYSTDSGQESNTSYDHKKILGIS